MDDGDHPWVMALAPAPNPWEGPPTLHQPRTVATCTVVIFARIWREGGGAEILL